MNAVTFGILGQELHGFQIDEGGQEYNPAGVCYRVDTWQCKGRCWAFEGRHFSVTRFDLVFSEDAVLTVHLPGCVHLCHYESVLGEELNPYRCLRGAEVIIRADNEKPYRVRYHKNTPIRATEITVSTGFCDNCLGGGGCGVLCSGAFANAEGCSRLPEMIKIFQQIRRCDYPPATAAVYYESKVMEAIALIASRTCADPKCRPRAVADMDGVTVAKAYIDDHYGSQITIDLLAKIACMSPGKLKYSFKGAYGTPVYQYITGVRMGRAEHLLSGTDLPVAQVAAATGYKKSGAFADVFRKHTGMLPRDFRRTARGV
ncbi:MAG: AraC family transcriptional regulator [Clostridiales bacterium]|jgi:AraC-like DNA-binding protein|nr:AraC family transcriptional regulator [Clostridiales bacterium]